MRIDIRIAPDLLRSGQDALHLGRVDGLGQMLPAEEFPAGAVALCQLPPGLGCPRKVRRQLLLPEKRGEILLAKLHIHGWHPSLCISLSYPITSFFQHLQDILSIIYAKLIKFTDGSYFKRSAPENTIFSAWVQSMVGISSGESTGYCPSSSSPR